MKPYYQDNHVMLYNKDCRSMDELTDNSVQCIVTSPPYYGLRRYDGGEQICGGDKKCRHEFISVPPRRAWRASDIVDLKSKEATNRGNLGIELKPTNFCTKCGAWRGQLGAEPSPELYIRHLIEIMREMKRVLRPDGVCWINIGDSWASGKGNCFNPGGGDIAFQNYLKENSVLVTERANKSDLDKWGVKPLDMVLIPSLLALAARADGWYMRSMVVWSKNNPMPESVNGWRWERHRIKAGNRGRNQAAQKGHFQSHSGNNVESDTLWQDCAGCEKCSPNDGYVLRKGSWRPTDSYEFILMLTKTGDYYSDREAVMEYSDTLESDKASHTFGGKKLSVPSSQECHTNLPGKKWEFNNKRNLRSVWEFPTIPYPGGHYATFPERLPEICIKASTSEKGFCPACDAPWARMVELKQHARHKIEPADRATDGDGANQGKHAKATESKTIGWRPTCKCNAGEPVPCTVLDPFAGSGTTLWVAKKLNRRAIGYEISEKYCRLSIERNRQQVII